MASISSLLIFAFCLSTGGLQMSESLLTLSYQNPNSFLIFSTVSAFVYFLVPLTFTVATLLLLLQLTKSDTNSPILVSFFKNLTMAAQAFAFATLLLGVALMAISSIPPNQEIEQSIWAWVVCLAAVLIRNSLKEYLKLDAGHHAPPLFALCISMAVQLLSEPLLSYTDNSPYNPLLNIPIHLLTYLQIPTFFLATSLLLTRIAVPRHSVERLDKAVQAMISTTVLTGLYVMVYLGVDDVAAIGGGGGATAIGLS